MIVYLLILLFQSNFAQDLNYATFPEGFLFGVATASYQVEGAWNESGKGENIWDRFTHTRNNMILDGATGDIACDSYHKTQEDVQLLVNLGVQFYRFSLSWSRILPTGFTNQINPNAIRYYNELIDALLANNIQPLVTLYHWDLPQPLQDIGGWPSAVLIDLFVNYSRVAFENFGDRVKYWLTFNEPKNVCLQGYGTDEKAPALESSGIGDYLCAHNVIRAHARTYHLYNDVFKPSQNGRISITVDTNWFEPGSNSSADVDASERMQEFTLGWYTNPIYHPDGDYPAIMKQYVAARSSLEGFSKSRLPEFTPEEIAYIKGTYDYFGLNHYSSLMVNDTAEYPLGTPAHYKDARVVTWEDPAWPNSASEWLLVVPWGFYKLLNWIKDKYGNPEVFITENGYSDLGQLDDYGRINYYELYLSALLDAIYKDGCNVTAYAAWSLMDNFEWRDGFARRLGLYHVDFNDPNRTRTKKLSADFYKEVIINRGLPLPETTTVFLPSTTVP